MAPTTAVAISGTLRPRSMANLRCRPRDAVRRPVRIALCESVQQFQPAQPRMLLGGSRDEVTVGGVGRQDPVCERVQGQAYCGRRVPVHEKEVRIAAGPPLELSESLRGAGRKLEVLDHAFASGALPMAQEDLDERV